MPSSLRPVAQVMRKSSRCSLESNNSLVKKFSLHLPPLPTTAACSTVKYKGGDIAKWRCDDSEAPSFAALNTFFSKPLNGNAMTMLLRALYSCSCRGGCCCATVFKSHACVGGDGMRGWTRSPWLRSLLPYSSVAERVRSSRLFKF